MVHYWSVHPSVHQVQIKRESKSKIGTQRTGILKVDVKMQIKLQRKGVSTGEKIRLKFNMSRYCEVNSLNDACVHGCIIRAGAIPSN